MNPRALADAVRVGVAAAIILVVAGCVGVEKPMPPVDLLDHPSEVGPRVRAVTLWETVPGWRGEVVDAPPYPGYDALIEDYPSFALYPEKITSVAPVPGERVEVRIERGTMEKNEISLIAPERLGEFLSAGQLVCVEVRDEEIAAISFDVTVLGIERRGSFRRVRSSHWLDDPEEGELPPLTVTRRTLFFEWDESRWNGEGEFGSIQFRPAGMSFFLEPGSGRGWTPGFDPEPWKIVDPR